MLFIKYVFCFFYLFLWHNVLGLELKNNFTESLVKYLKEYSSLYQVVFIIEDDSNDTDSRTNSIVQDVLENFPSLSITSDQIQSKLHVTYLPTLKRPKKTTLFILIVEKLIKGTYAKIDDTLTSLSRLSEDISRPKFLIIFLLEEMSLSLKNRFKNYWKKKFLDVAIVEHVKDHQSDKNTVKYIVKLHEFNPFTDDYRTIDVTSRTRWFSDKLSDLNGYELQIKYFENLTADPIRLQYFGYMKLANLLGESMNFTVNVLVQNSSNLEITSTNLGKSEFVLNALAIFIENGFIPQHQFFDMTYVNAIVPKVSRFTRVLIVSQELLYMLLITFVTIFSIQALSWLLKFDKRIWKLLNLVQILMGMVVDREPTTLTERIVFGSLLVTCIVYTSYFFSAVLEISLQKEPEINTIEDIVESNLIPLIQPLLNNAVRHSPVVSVQQLQNKSVNYPINAHPFECITSLVNHLNITCIFLNTNNYVNYYMLMHPNLNFKVIQEPILQFPKSWISTFGSPYIDRFDETIQKATEAGLLIDIEKVDVNIFNDVNLTEGIEKDKLFLILIYVLGIGYSLSLIAFIGEIVINIGLRPLFKNCIKLYVAIRQKMQFLKAIILRRF